MNRKWLGITILLGLLGCALVVGFVALPSRAAPGGHVLDPPTDSHALPSTTALSATQTAPPIYGSYVPGLSPAHAGPMAITARDPISVRSAAKPIANHRTCWARLNDQPTDYATVQAAVDASTHPSDVVKVAGTCAGVTVRAGVSQTVYLTKTLTLRGGYTTTNWTDPDPNAYPTTLDAQSGGRVIYATGDISPTIEGLRITGGDATGLRGGFQPWLDAGGGIYIRTTMATISNCLIYSNTASTVWHGSGGGIAIEGNDDILVLGNVIRGNTASSRSEDDGWEDLGGGLYAFGSAAVISDNQILSNTASVSFLGVGGGLFLYGSPAVVTGNTVRGNRAGGPSPYGVGGGLSLLRSSAVISHNLIESNLAGDSVGLGGGLDINSSNGAEVNGNTILGNSGPSHTGGLHVADTQAISITNNLIVDNYAESYGGALMFDCPDDTVTTASLRHNTIADNRGDTPSVYLDEGATVEFTNTIVAGDPVLGVYVASGATASLEATLWHGNGTNTWGEGVIATGTVNIYGDPAFVAPGDGDYHIGLGSMAIDAGVDAGITGDIDGDPRPLDLDYDIGADEFRGPGLEVHKEAQPNPVRAGTELTYTLYLTNIGGLSFSPTLTDYLPLHVTPGGVLTWTPPALLPGEIWTETVVVSVEAGYAGLLTNVVQVTTTEGITSTDTAVVQVQQAVEGLGAVNDSPTALDQVTNLTATVSAGSHVTYTWGFGDEASGSGPLASHIYPSVGSYTAVVTAGNSVSLLTATTTVTVEEAVVTLMVTNDSPTVLGNATVLSATVSAGNPATYSWVLGDGGTSSGATLAHVYPEVGVYTAVVTAGNHVSELTATTEVTIVAVPIEGLEATNDSPSILGTPTLLTATVTAGGSTTYTWALGDGGTGSGPLLAHTYPAADVYTAVVTASNSVSTLTATTLVRVTAPRHYIYLPILLHRTGCR